MRTTACLWFAFTIAILLSGASPAPGETANEPRPATDAQLRAILEPIRKKADLPALAAAVVTSKGAVAVAAVGVRKKGGEVAVTAQDQFHLGSDTKAMTAALIAILIEQGKLKWDSTVGETFPDLAPKMTPELRKVTLTQLLSHRSGLPANLPGGWDSVPRDGSPIQQRRVMMERLAGQELAAKPGEKFLYSNTGYTVAAAMAEKVTGKPWEELMADRLFKPLDMTDVGFGSMGTPGKVDQPWQHQANGTPVEPGPSSDNPPVMGPAGTVHAPLAEWAKFIADQLKGDRGERGLLTPPTYKVLHSSPGMEPFYTPGGWGGVEKEPRAGGLVLSHDGSNTMNFATAWLAPGRDFAVLVTCNQGGDEARKACHQVRDQIIKEFLPLK
jgi:CubicO group peptidase (beta-lactamase class C family)